MIPRNRRLQIALAAISLIPATIFFATHLKAQPQQKPNILVIMGDDIG